MEHYLVAAEYVGGEAEDPATMRIVAVEGSERDARGHLPDGAVAWPEPCENLACDEPCVSCALDSFMLANSVREWRVERFQGTCREVLFAGYDPGDIA